MPAGVPAAMPAPGISVRGGDAALPKGERHRALDVARMFAAVMILILHGSASYVVAGGAPIFGREAYLIAGGLGLWGRVPFFFFLSGYFAMRSLEKSPDQAEAFVKKRIATLLPPYLFWNFVAFSLMWVAVQAGFRLAGDSRVDPFAMLMRVTGFGLHPAGDSLWFVRDLLICSCFAPLLHRLGFWILIPCIGLTITPDIPTELFEHGCPRPSSLGYFGLGMLLFHVPAGTIGRWFPRPGTSFLLCLFVGLAFVIGEFPRPDLAGVACGALGILLFGHFIDRSAPRLATWMSRHVNASFIIFAANAPYYAVVKQLYIRYQPPVPQSVYFVMLTVLFFFMAIAFHSLVKHFFPKVLILITGGR